MTRYDVEATHPPRLFYAWRIDYLAFSSSPALPSYPLRILEYGGHFNNSSRLQWVFVRLRFPYCSSWKISPIIAVVHLPTIDLLPVSIPSKTLAQPIYHTSPVHIPHSLFLFHHGFSLLFVSPCLRLRLWHCALYVLHSVSLARWARPCCWYCFAERPR